jgi:hypothetical protein
MLAIALLAAGAALELEISGGGAAPLDPEFGSGPTSIASQARVGVDFADHVTVSGALFGVPGPEATRDSCGNNCNGNASFRALSGLAIVRLHSAGKLQGFLEGGLGAGKLSSLSADDLFENPAEHGRAGLSLWLGGERPLVRYSAPRPGPHGGMDELDQHLPPGLRLWCRPHSGHVEPQGQHAATAVVPGLASGLEELLPA